MPQQPWWQSRCRCRRPANGLPLRWRLQFANQPTDIAGFHWIRRYRDFFDVIAPGAIEPAKFKSSGPRRDARKRHARLALWAAKSLNGKQRDYGWIIGHGLRLKIWRERKTPGRREMPTRNGDEAASPSE